MKENQLREILFIMEIGQGNKQSENEMKIALQDHVSQCIK